ncbi:MAG: GTP-binding protein, partial [Leptolyngbya sp. SIO1D8]|nr:GTP-binding protein [Leptolyngbya sp. SIO1D8]
MVIAKKICLIGDFAVGKTSLIRRYVDRQFSDEYLSTVGVKISRKRLDLAPVNNSPSVQLQLIIWDLEGRTKFEAIAPGYLQGASGAIVVGALDRQTTLTS